MKKKMYPALALAGGLLLCFFLLIPTEMQARDENEYPVARCRDITVQIDASGAAWISFDDINDESYDPDGTIDWISIDKRSFYCRDVHNRVEVKLTVQDNEGLTDYCWAEVYVEDLLDPIVVPNPVTIELDEWGNAHVSDEMMEELAETSDNCDILEIWLYPNAFSCRDLGRPDATIRVTDTNGNVTELKADLTVVDKLPPEISCHDITVNLDATGYATIDEYDILASYSDNCYINEPLYSLNQYDFYCDDAGRSNYVTLSADDGSGNIGTCQAKITVKDVTPPVAKCKEEVHVNLGPDGTYKFSQSALNDGSYDLCSSVIFFMDWDKADCSDVQVSPVSRRMFVMDDYGNEDYCYSNVYVHDITPPSITCPPDITVAADPDFCGAKNVLLGTPVASDNCSYTLGKNGPSTFPIGPTTVTWTAVDDAGLESSCPQMVTVEDKTPPVLTGCPADITVQCYMDVPAAATVTAFDACTGTVTVSFEEKELMPGNTCSNFIVRHWTASDQYGNATSCTQVITVNDDVPPVVACPAEAFKISDKGECTYTAVGDEFDATATDYCNEITSMKWRLTGATEGSGFTTLDGVEFNFGFTLVTWFASDNCNNVSVCSFYVMVSKIITITEVTVTPDVQQYSDPVTFTATIQPGACTGAGQAATHVTFYVGNQPMGDPVPLVPEGGILTASKEYPLLEYPGFEGTMDPSVNTKTVTAEFSGVNPNFEVTDPTTELTVTPENACAVYAGVYYASTGSVNSDEATVVLAATLVEEDDGWPGDFYNHSSVQFLADDREVATTPVVPVTPVNGELPTGPVGTPAVGAASYEWTGVLIGVYDIRAEVMGYYTNDPEGDCDGEAVVTVGKPSSDFISGGGFVLLENPMGLAAGDIGSKNNFGFNVKYNRKMTNLQGNINTIIRRTEADGLHIYQAKGNVMSSLTVTGDQAVFTGKCSLRDITDPDFPVDVTGGGGATLQFTMTDNGEPGTGDLISITVWKKDGGLWFTNLWDAMAYKPIEQLLDGGNLVVHSAKDEEGGGIKPPKKKVAEIPGGGLQESLTVYPNPFSDRLFFEFTPHNNAAARLEIFDGVGRKLTTLLDRNVEAGVPLRLEYQPPTLVGQILFYRLTLGNRALNGKVLYRK